MAYRQKTVPTVTVFGGCIALSQAASLFDPAQHLLNPSSCIQRVLVALKAPAALVNCRSSNALGGLQNMRCDATPAHDLHELFGAITLVGTHGSGMRSSQWGHHLLRGIPLAIAISAPTLVTIKLETLLLVTATGWVSGIPGLGSSVFTRASVTMWSGSQ